MRFTKGLGGVCAVGWLATCVGATANAEWTATNLSPAGAVHSKALGVWGTQQCGVVWNQVSNPSAQASLWNQTAASWSVVSSGSAILRMSETQKVGYTGKFTTEAALWNGSSGTRVELDPASSFGSIATDVAAGQQVGHARILVNQVLQYHAGLWTGSKESWVLLRPAGATASHAFGTDGQWQVGSAFVNSATRASLWNGTAESWVDLNPAGSVSSVANAVDAGRQVGKALVGGIFSASLWTGTASSWVDMNPLGSTESEISDTYDGRHVGFAIIAGVRRAGIWMGDSADSWVDLHASVPAGILHSQALGIWSDGSVIRVVGSGENYATGRTEALLWTMQVPGPASIAPLMLGMTLATRRRRPLRTSFAS